MGRVEWPAGKKRFENCGRERDGAETGWPVVKSQQREGGAGGGGGGRRHLRTGTESTHSDGRLLGIEEGNSVGGTCTSSALEGTP